LLRVFVGERAEAFPPVASRFSAFKRAGSAGMSLDFLFALTSVKLFVWFSFQKSVLLLLFWDDRFPS
jgi:hypothetical protein